MENRHEEDGNVPIQDQALTALAALLEAIGEEAGQAWFRNGPGDDRIFANCVERAEIVVRCIVRLPAASLHGASAKVTAARTSRATVLLGRSLVDALATDMHRDVVRLRASTEVAGHA